LRTRYLVTDKLSRQTNNFSIFPRIRWKGAVDHCHLKIIQESKSFALCQYGTLDRPAHVNVAAVKLEVALIVAHGAAGAFLARPVNGARLELEVLAIHRHDIGANGQRSTGTDLDTFGQVGFDGKATINARYASLAQAKFRRDFGLAAVLIEWIVIDETVIVATGAGQFALDSVATAKEAAAFARQIQTVGKLVRETRADGLHRSVENGPKEKVQKVTQNASLGNRNGQSKQQPDESAGIHVHSLAGFGVRV
jgi:hypothetical protein